MDSIFPAPITTLPEADIPFQGVRAYLSQAENHQIIFMEFSQDVEVPEHAHRPQWAVVLEGQIDMMIGSESRTFRKGDRYFIPEGVKHSARIHAGYADVTLFDQPDRYMVK